MLIGHDSRSVKGLTDDQIHCCWVVDAPPDAHVRAKCDKNSWFAAAVSAGLIVRK
jgi:hypothetical protein